MSKIYKTKLTLTDISNEYLPDALQDDDEMFRLKTIIQQLSPSDRNILLLYSEEESLRHAAKKLGGSSGTRYLKILEIRDLIKKKLKNDC